jgi:hypothetical protein
MPDDRERLAELQHRLNDGWAMIDAGKAKGTDTRAWEDFWIKLLHEYERLADRLR